MLAAYLGGRAAPEEEHAIEVRGHGLEVTRALNAYAERRARFSLSRFAPRIDRLVVTLRDANGPRGGVDKECRIRARLRPSGTLRVEEQGTDMYAAIDGAWGRLARAVSREVARRREARVGPRSAGLDGSGRD